MAWCPFWMYTERFYYHELTHGQNVSEFEIGLMSRLIIFVFCLGYCLLCNYEPFKRYLKNFCN